MAAPEHADLHGVLKQALKSQYLAALSMLRQAVEHCPETVWVTGSPPFWQIVYHTIFYAHFYLGKDVQSFRAWEHHRPRIDSFDSPPVPIGEPYTQLQMLDYLSKCAAMVGPAIDAMNLAARDSGFPWYEVSKLEHQIINIRHIHHHAIYLSARLGASGQERVNWISPSRSGDNEMRVEETR